MLWLRLMALALNILAADAKAYQLAYSDSYRTIFLTSIAFGVNGITCIFFVPNIEELMTDNIVATLARRNGNRIDLTEKEIKGKFRGPEWRRASSRSQSKAEEATVKQTFSSNYLTASHMIIYVISKNL